MSITIISGVIVALVVISLVVSSISYNRQKAIAHRNKMLAKLRANTVDFASCIQLLLQVDEEYEILILFQKQLLKLLLNIQELASDDPKIASELIKEQNNLMAFKEGKRQTKVSLVETSNEDLTSTKMQLGRISKQLDIFRNKGLVSSDKCDGLKEHIRKIQVCLDVESHKAQANHYALENDVALNLNHLQQARDALTKSSVQFDEKQAQIKELTDMINEIRKTNKVIILEQPKTAPQKSNTEGDDSTESAEAKPEQPDSQAQTSAQ